MLSIRRTEDGKLHVANSRNSQIVDTEKQARSVAESWGHGNISIIAQIEAILIAEGKMEPRRGWNTRRSEDSAAPSDSTLRKAEEGMSEAPAKKRVRTRKKIEEPVAFPLEIGSSPAQETYEQNAENPAAEFEVEVMELKQEPVPVPAGIESRIRPRKRGMKATALSAPTEDTEPNGDALQKHQKPHEGLAGVEAAAPVETLPAQRSRARREPSKVEGDTSMPTQRESALEQAQRLFEEGSRLLHQIERDVLPFARGPWTELREQAEQIAASLGGGKKRRTR